MRGPGRVTLRTPEMRIHFASGFALAFCGIIAIVHRFRLLDNSTSLEVKSAVSRGNARLVQLGEDSDWHVKNWDKEHLNAVASGRVGPTTVRNIWKSKDKAWSGIDDILPTTGGYLLRC
jgi:hypothetical protein